MAERRLATFPCRVAGTLGILGDGPFGKKSGKDASAVAYGSRKSHNHVYITSLVLLDFKVCQ